MTFERKIQIAARAYRLLTQQAGYRPCDMIFDLNVLSIGTGIPEHARFAVDFIEGVRWVKHNLPGALTSGGISNLSFAFRGNNAVREAMHSIFLYHAIKAGLDMAIVNPQMLQLYDEIDPRLLRAIEDVIFDRDEEATARLTELAGQWQQEGSTGGSAGARADGQGTGGGDGGLDAGRKDGAGSQADGQGTGGADLTAEERLQQAIIRGGSATLAEDTLAELERLGSAVAVVEGPLMQAMARVGERFAEGKMFLPQVVKSAKMMRQAVQILEPYMGTPAAPQAHLPFNLQAYSATARTSVSGSGASVSEGASDGAMRKPRFVIATIRGDVHDIGKNITSIVLQCGGFEVYDMGVMVPAEDILAKAREVNADIIGVSGLITPSLYRMEELCQMMAREGFTTPLFVGGAAASAVHTAVKLAPLYADVHYGADASVTAVMAKKYLAAPAVFRAEEAALHERLRDLHAQGAHPAPPAVSVPTSPAADTPVSTSSAAPDPGASPSLTQMVFEDIPLLELPLEQLRPFLDWRLFDAAYGIKSNAGPEAAGLSAQSRKDARRLLSEKRFSVRLNARFFPCFTRDESICAADGSFSFPMLRDRRTDKFDSGSLADFFPPAAKGLTAPLGLFAICVKDAAPACPSPDAMPGDSLSEDSLLLHALKAMLAESASSWLQHRLESVVNSLSADAPSKPYRVILPGIGYACCPDHSLKRDILSRLDPDLGITLSESCAMLPVESICGLAIAARGARYPDIRNIAPETLSAYARKRGFSPEEQALFLGHLK